MFFKILKFALAVVLCNGIILAQELLPVKITADTQYEKEKDVFVFEGYVILEYKDLVLQSDKAIYNRKTNELTALGDVTIHQQNQSISAEKLLLNLKTEKGTLYNVFAYEDPDLTLTSVQLDKIDKDLYKGKRVDANECKQRIPHWSVSAGKAKMKVDKWLRMNNFVFKIKNVPILYLPFMQFPLKKERSTGFLFPKFGPNSLKGFYVGNAFFWAINRSNDLTFYLDRWWDRGCGEGAEYNYAMTEGIGYAKGFYIRDPLIGQQWSFNGKMNQILFNQFQLSSQVDWFSSLDYIRDYENSFSRLSRRYKLFRAYLTRNWSYYAFNAIFENQETLFSSSSSITTKKFPEIEFQKYNQQIGKTPLYFTFTSNYGYFGKKTFNSEINYNRLDFYPQLSLPLSGLQWLTFTPTFSFRTTYYSNSLDAQNRPVNKSLFRKFMSLSLDLRGPNFSRIYDTPHLSFTPKIKHAIEPRISYVFISSFTSDTRIISIDEIDTVYSTNMITYGIANRIFIKKKISGVETPWELLSWDVSQNYLIENNVGNINIPQFRPYKFSPISSLLRFNPSYNFSVDFRLEYNLQEKSLSNISLSNSFNSQNFSLNLSWNYYNYFLSAQNKTSNNQLRANSSVKILNNRFNISTGLDYNISQRNLLSVLFGLIYNDDCFSVGVEYRRFNILMREESQWYFSLSFPRIGRVLDYHTGFFNEIY